ncbi:MAG: hypothetical protein DRJ01_07825, partial [Bacteroidetes bacterium]
MKRFVLVFIVFLLAANLFAQRQKNIDKAKIELSRYGDLYFSFKITKANNFKTIPDFISIDNVKDGIVYAYINEKDFQKFINLNIPFTVIKKDKDVKALTMATTVAEMSNWDRYPTHDVYLQMMQDFATNYPNICRLDTIGFSQNDRPIIAVKISDHPDIENDEPQFFYTGQMHGDELVDYILFLRLIDYLTTNYGTNDQVTNLLDNIEIWINPLANPDGTYNGGDDNVSSASRYLANGVDPNRNFPYVTGKQSKDLSKETISMMNFADNHRFVMSANSHSGAEVVNYPWDSWDSSTKTHADDDWWQFVSLEYANLAISNSPTGYLTGVSSTGITNGGDWYVVYGSRQDYMNYYKHCREVTLELSDSKLLSSDLLPNHWDYNRQAMLDYMQECLYGITGKVTDVNTGNPIVAKVEIDNHDKDSSFVYSNSTYGSYYRPIYQGTYSLTFSAPDYQTYHVSNVSVANKDTTILNVQLVPLENHSPEILDSLGHSADTLLLTVFKDSITSVKVNVNDEDGDNLDVSWGTSLLQNGGVNIYPYCDTSFVYTPKSGFVGDDLLKIVVSDDGSPVLSDTVYYKVTVIVKPINHNPVIIDNEGHPVDSINILVAQNTPTSVKLNVNDEDGDNVDVSYGESISGNGCVDISPANDTCFVYTPNTDYVGEDLLQIIVSDDGSPVLSDTVYYMVNVTSNQTNHKPVILDSLGNDVDTLLITVCQDSSISVKVNVNDEDGDNLDVNQGVSLLQNGGVNIYPYNDTSFVYTPKVDFVGDDLLQIVVSDDGSPVLTDTVYYKVSVIQNLINHNPVILDSEGHPVDTLIIS